MEFSNLEPNGPSSASFSICGVRYGTKTTTATTSANWTNSFGISSYNYGNFKFGTEEVKCSSSTSILFSNDKMKFKLNSLGVEKYNYNNDTWETFLSFSGQQTISTMTDTLLLFGQKQIAYVTDIDKTHIEYMNSVSGYLKFYGMEIYENNTLMAKFTPAKLGNKIGVYDEVAQKMLDGCPCLVVGNEV